VSKTDVMLRPAVAADAGALSDLAVRSKSYWGYPSGFIDACRGELICTPDQINSAEFTFTVAQLAGRPIGFYALEELPAGKLDLNALFVEPGHIGAGIGRALMVHARNVAAQTGATQVVIQSDPHARAFYEHMGAEYDGEEESGSIPGRYLPVLVISLG
jgi:GNAT superfamily N-acetyltransferase